MKLLFIVLCILLLPLPVRAAMPLNEFAAIPVQHEGRMKPLDSFARAELKSISGQNACCGLSAMEWLSAVLFEPFRAVRIPVFLIENKTLRQQLGLPERTRKTYSLAEILPTMENNARHIHSLAEKNPQSLNADETAWLALAEQTSRLVNLLGSTNLFLPLGAGDAPQKSYFETLRTQPDLEAKIRLLVQAKGSNLSRYPPHQMAMIETGMRLDHIRRAADRNNVLRVIPPVNPGQAEWLTPWTALQKDAQLRLYEKPIQNWQNLIIAWQEEDVSVWHSTITQITNSNNLMLPEESLSWRLPLEVFYHAYNPLAAAMACYVIVIVFFISSHFFGRNSLSYAAFAAASLGLICHVIAIIIRILILMRPPVGTLYETLLFVSLIAAAIPLFSRVKSFQIAGLCTSVGLLLCAPVFASGDTLEMLVAVLNTSFWLSTHVICITAAYAFCIIAAALANLMLWQQSKRDAAPNIHFALLHKLLLIALFLTALGTVLGGIWADQSWGRFWGWDPKENGALLIVLWITWILHGRIGGKLGMAAFTALSAALSIIVALSWFGVNLLGAGLHSYGFTSGIAVGLATFCAAQLAYIFFTLRRRNEKTFIA